MRIVVDANVLIQIIKSGGRNDLYCPRTNGLVAYPEARAEALVELFSDRKDQILIPSPAFAEVLVRIDEGLHHVYRDAVDGVSCFQQVPFDAISAIECARLVTNHELKQLQVFQDNKKISFDRQIIAICKAHGADELWTHDVDMFKKAESVGIEVKSLADIEPKMTQMDFIEADQSSA